MCVMDPIGNIETIWSSQGSLSEKCFLMQKIKYTELQEKPITLKHGCQNSFERQIGNTILCVFYYCIKFKNTLKYKQIKNKFTFKDLSVGSLLLLD